MDILKIVQQTATKTMKEMQHFSFEKGLETVQAGKRRLFRKIINAYKYLKEECKGDGNRLFKETGPEETEIYGVSCELQEVLYCEGDQALMQIAQRISILGDGPAVPGGPAWSGQLDLLEQGRLYPQVSSNINHSCSFLPWPLDQTLLNSYCISLNSSQCTS